eukprot:9607750-Heterocapsa_arctica.AAC.1
MFGTFPGYQQIYQPLNGHPWREQLREYMADLSAFDEVARIAEEWAAFDLKQMSNTFFTNAIAPPGFEDIEHSPDCNLDEGNFYCGEADLG